MAQIPEKVKELFKKQQTFVIATSSKDGIPNAVPMGTVKMLDDETIVISNQFWKKTLQNLNENPELAITFWEGFKGYQIKGNCELMTEGKVFEETAAWTKEVGKKLGMPLISKGVALIKVKEVYSVTPGPEAGKKLA